MILGLLIVFAGLVLYLLAIWVFWTIGAIHEIKELKDENKWLRRHGLS